MLAIYDFSQEFRIRGRKPKNAFIQSVLAIRQRQDGLSWGRNSFRIRLGSWTIRSSPFSNVSNPENNCQRECRYLQKRTSVAKMYREFLQDIQTAIRSRKRFGPFTIAFKKAAIWANRSNEVRSCVFFYGRTSHSHSFCTEFYVFMSWMESVMIQTVNSSTREISSVQQPAIQMCQRASHKTDPIAFPFSHQWQWWNSTHSSNCVKISPKSLFFWLHRFTKSSLSIAISHYGMCLIGCNNEKRRR